MLSRMATMPMSRSARMRTPSSKFRLNPVQEGDRDGVPGPDHLHQVLQPERAREWPVATSAVDQVGADAVGFQELQLVINDNKECR